MKLYSGPLSLFSRKVEIALREKGLAFDRLIVAFSQESGYSPKHPDVLAVNPAGTGRYTRDSVNRSSHTDHEISPTKPSGTR